MDEENFEWVQWILEKRVEKEWSQSDLAHKSDVSRATISDYELYRRTKPDYVTLAKIAVAFGYPPEVLLRLAKILPPEPKIDPLMKLIIHLSEQLPTEEDKKDAAEYIRLRLRLAEERGKHESKDQKRVPKT